MSERFLRSSLPDAIIRERNTPRVCQPHYGKLRGIALARVEHRCRLISMQPTKMLAVRTTKTSQCFPHRIELAQAFCRHGTSDTVQFEILSRRSCSSRIFLPTTSINLAHHVVHEFRSETNRGYEIHTEFGVWTRIGSPRTFSDLAATE